MKQCACPIPNPAPIDGDGLIAECNKCGGWYCAVIGSLAELEEFERWATARNNDAKS